MSCCGRWRREQNDAVDRFIQRFDPGGHRAALCAAREAQPADAVRPVAAGARAPARSGELRRERSERDERRARARADRAAEHLSAGHHRRAERRARERRYRRHSGAEHERGGPAEPRAERHDRDGDRADGRKDRLGADRKNRLARRRGGAGTGVPRREPALRQEAAPLA